MGRFVAMNKPKALPGCCFICRSANNGPFVDTGKNVRGMGAVYVCATCLTEMFGLIEDSVATEHRKYTQADINRAAQLASVHVAAYSTELVVDIEGAISGYRDRVKSAARDALLALVAESQGVQKDAGEPEGSSAGTDGTPVENGGPASEQGPDDVPSNSSDGKLEFNDDLFSGFNPE